MNLLCHRIDGRIQITFPQCIIQLPLIQSSRSNIAQTLRRILQTIAQLDAVFIRYNAVPYIHYPAQHCPRRTCRIEQRIACIEQIRLHPMMFFPHGILQYRLIQQHLYPIVLFRFYLAPDSIFIRLTRFHFDERRHITLHIIQTSLQT